MLLKGQIYKQSSEQKGKQKLQKAFGMPTTCSQRAGDLRQEKSAKIAVGGKVKVSRVRTP